MTYYGIYKITNLLNGKMYIGQHTTSNIDDSYMGSGKIIRQAVKKYGKENFRKEWLMFCEDEEELNYMERVYVDQTWVDRSDTYNLNLGGNQQHISEQTRKKMSKAQKGIKRIYPKGKKLSDEHKKKIGLTSKGRIKSHNTREKISKTLLGHGFSDESKKKMSESHKGKKHSEEWKRKQAEAIKLWWSKKKESRQ